MSENLWKFIHSFGKTFNPSSYNASESFCCMFDCLAILWPDDVFRSVLTAFIRQNPPSKYTGCSDKTFEWTYKLRVYYNMVLKRRGQPSETMTLNQLREQYTVITKTDWGNATWFVMHYMSANLPVTLNPTVSTSFKAFVVCLSFLIPCEECKSHMNKYIENSEIDTYLKTGNDAFGWTWYFHNQVNQRTGKPTVDFNQALSMYTIPKRGYSFIDY